MRIRCDLGINGGERTLAMIAGPSEPDEHLAHKLAAYILFWNDEPTPDPSLKMPALSGYEFMPDLIAFDDGGGIKLWVECGSVTMNKLTKVTRRAPRARIVVLKEFEREAARLRAELDGQFDRPERVEILAWPGNSYKEWIALVSPKTEAFGESDGRMINAVVNATPVLVEFRSF